QQIQEFIHANGYDKPIPVQYGIWVDNVVHGNLGYSLKLNQSVGALIADRLPKTVVLMAISIGLALIIAVPLGIYQARRRNTVGDYTVTSLSFIFYAMPSFLLGQLLILVFSTYLGWFAPTAPQTGNVGQILAQGNALVLPITTLALITIATFSRYTRSSVMENLTQEYVRTAQANGAGEGRVIVVHVLRNALIPIATLLGLSLPALVAGAAITESVFNYPGMGYTFITEAQVRDYPTVLGIALVIAVVTVVGSLLADIAYAVLDPRVKYS
ncbi:MAG TPA: ABC transporter permease, partial [Pseudonocardiaceae bacterium]